MRISFTRLVPLVMLSGALCAVGAGCREEKTAPARSEPATPAPRAVEDGPKPSAGRNAGTLAEAPVAPGPSAVRDAGSGVAAEVDAGAAAPLAPGALSRFTGFNADETRYAFSVYSEGAGAHLLNIVVGQQGTPVQRYLLDSEDSEKKAQAALAAGGFTPQAGKLPPSIHVEAAAKDGKAKVTVSSDGGPPRIVYDQNPFLLGGGGAKVAKATVEKVSPSGNVVAVRVESVPMTEFGGATTVVLVRVGQGR